MASSKWLVVAKNEYRTHVNNVRKIRPYFPYLVVGALAVYVAYIAPTIVGLFLDEFSAFILSQLALILIPLIMFLFFVYLILLPITYALQSVQAGRTETFLAAPIRPSDILLGEFLGVAPFYAIAIVVIAGFFTAALAPLGLDIIQITITVAVFVITFLSALWIGTVFAALLRTRIAGSPRARDIGRALSLVIALPIVAVMYAMIGGGFLQALADPAASGVARTVLNLFPSSWGADLIVKFASSPGNISAMGFETVTKFSGLAAFFVVVLWLGTRAAGRAYKVEPTTFTAATARADGVLYRTARLLGGGGSTGSLFVSVSKDYGRRLENLSRIIYIVAIFAMVNIFLVEGLDPEGILIMSQFWFAFLAVLTVGQVTVYGKEGLFIFKKTPNGIGKFIKAKLVLGLLVAVPITVVISLLSLLFAEIGFVSLLTYIALLIPLIAGNVVLAVGLALLRPEFSDNPRSQMGGLMVNANIVMVVSIGIFLGSLIVFHLPIFYTILLENVVIWLLGAATLYLGKTKLSKLE